MGCAEQSELNVSREHRLHRTPGNDVNELRLEIVFAENALLLGEPQRHRVAADRAVGEKKFRRRVGAMSGACPQATTKKRRQPSTLHRMPTGSERFELFERLERLELSI